MTSTVFNSSDQQVKKSNKVKTIFLVLKRIIKNNPKLFFFCFLLATCTAVVNFNVNFNLKMAFRTEEGSIFDKKTFIFGFNFFGLRCFENRSLDIWGFLWRELFLIFIIKSGFSLLHYYWNSYAYDRVEKDLKKDLFRHFIWAKYSNSSLVSRNLVSQFAGDLDNIANNVWFIPNRIFYVITYMFMLIKFDFGHGLKGINWKFLIIVASLFAVLVITEIILFKKAVKLNIAAKKRYEEDNKMIYERINNLEYIKAVSGEKYEEEKISKRLDETFQKNKKSLLYSVLFKAIPNYLIIPNIPVFFTASALLLASPIERGQEVFLVVNFIMYYDTVRRLNSEVNKIVDSLMNLDDLAINIAIVSENVTILNKESSLSASKRKLNSFSNGDITFQNVVFAYPQRPNQDILRDFTFTFIQGKSYGIAGKNGIGKSTVIKNTLKLYSLKEGVILIGGQDIQKINSESLHKRICYQTNRPGFFNMSIAENVLYPNKYDKNSEKIHDRLIYAAQKVGILEFIEKLPKGFDTELKERGSDLSEGQKQQISAMKIFIYDYDIYFLDEILSNVHPVLKGIILQNIFHKIKDKTVIAIDHHYEIFQQVNYVYQFTGDKLIKMDKERFIQQ